MKAREVRKVGFELSFEGWVDFNREEGKGRGGHIKNLNMYRCLHGTIIKPT